MKALFRIGKICLVDIEHISCAFRRQDVIEGNKSISRFTKEMTDWFRCYTEASSELLHYGFVDEGRVEAAMQNMLQAMENRDYILLSDLLELTLKPLLFEIQGCLIATGCWECEYAQYESNVMLLREYCPRILKTLQILDQTDTKEHRVKLYHSLCHTYVDTGKLEPTSSGHVTFAFLRDGKRFYAHSNVNPVAEAGAMVESYYDIGKDDYFIFGLGLGYLPAALFDLDGGLSLAVYEMNRDVLMMAILAGDLSWLPSKRVRLLYDPDGSKLAEYLDANVVPILHRPSIEAIFDDGLREKLALLAMRDVNIRHYQRMFKENARENLKNCTEVIDVLKPCFQNKNAIIVAAGPSLAKNIDLLKNAPKGTLIIAVCTVLKRLLSIGVRPDYAVFLDQNPEFCRQIEGIEQETIPILIAGTTNRGIAEAYKGPKYLVCQKDNTYTEELAKERKCIQFSSGGNVSTFALDICLQMGCTEIAFVGFDMAFTGGLFHEAEVEKQHGLCASKLIPEERDFIPVKGVFGDTLYTSKVFFAYKQWVERRINGLPKYRVIDATEGGAKKEGMKVMTLQQVYERWNQHVI